MRKWLSLRRWSHVLRNVWRLLRSPRVPLRDKLLFVVPVLVYTVAPDVLPLVPIDDIGVAMIAAKLFVSWVERRYPDA
ncbi:hypothetical protein ACFQWB_15215 [Paenibacillus thermoaerophilus]|uniref:DUF1232 domain-containing protein n=1 Tax=Paenibacillus thermoaerophilus TaxID=1215385 RepID=A0ABW2V8Q1_9BACL|nr:hypothetical protein [Paenibacillus thermoaerophilus]TMV17916.1 hypothetical protein FE781_05565 [Paenibacillus thermoaerophilus]